MSQLTIDSTLLERLNGLKEETEYLDENGHLLGHFVPALKGPVELLPSDQCPYTQEELVRMRNATGGRPLTELWKSLGVE